MTDSTIDRLLDVMSALRNPETGCPWDLQQTFATIAPYTIEEAYEVADAIDRGNLEDLRDELGDLLLQVVFHAQMGAERKAFDFADVVTAIVDKMVRRHPHVFGQAVIRDAASQTAAWEAHKRRERQAKQAGAAGVLDGVGLALPALSRAAKLGRRAAEVGFDWPNTDGVRAKVAEELAEMDEALSAKNQAATREEIGDLLFAVAQLARHLDIDPEEALRAANAKFTRRFGKLETQLSADGLGWGDRNAEDLEERWEAAKREP